MKKRTIGIILLIFPWVLLPASLAGYAIFALMIANFGADAGGIRTVSVVVTTFLYLAGFVSVLGFLIGTPVGLYLVSRKDEEKLAALRAHPRFKDLSDEDFRYVTGWSWGAFFCAPVWALGNKLWLWALGSLVPFWNIFVWVKLSADGRQTAWERSGETIAAFKRRQTIVAWVVAALLVLAIVNSAVRTITKLSSLSAVHSSKTISCAGVLDTDGDDLPDADEKKFGTDSTLVDTDGDGFSDYAELLGGYDPNDGVAMPDADADGLADGRERTFYSSDPNDSDSDNDGVSDLDEVHAGTNPDGTGDMKRVQAMYQLKISVGRKNCQE